MSIQSAPKVFVSHATEDKERFVKDFATRLRTQGVDAWYDTWEIMPGDSLVDKIFEEGLKEAQAVIIVLSNISVQKPWVREELNTSVVKKITKQARIIPVVIDPDCEIPQALQSTLWVKVPDLQNYEEALRRIVNAIHGVSEKPSLGKPPRHVQLGIDKMPGLSSIDTKVFKAACEVVLQSNSAFVDQQELMKSVQALDISDRDLLESVHILHDRGLTKIHWTMNDGLPSFEITVHGFENYGKFYIDEFDQLPTRVLLIIINDNLATNGAIADKLGISPVMDEFLLDMLTQRKYIRVSKSMGNIRDNVTVQDVTVQGRRFAEQQG